MTPEEAVEQLRERLTTGRLKAVAKLIDACVTTAKAEAKKNEMLRCAAKARYCGQCELADDILRTGELEADGSDAKMKPDGPGGPSL